MTPVSGETAIPEAGVVEGIFGDQSRTVYRYVELLTTIGVQRGLLGPREAPKIWQRHILNCAVVAPLFPRGGRLCDVGSGAGLPGLVLALARPDLHVTLLDPLLRRTTFLTEVVAELALTNVVIRRGRAEELAGQVIFDAVTARAVAPLTTLIRWGLPLVRRGGELIAFKGSNASTEVAAAQSELKLFTAGQVRIEAYGAGIVEPETTVVRIESSGKQLQ